MKTFIKTSKILATFAFLLLTIFTSCKKERLESQKSGAAYSSPDAFYDAYKQEEQVFQVDSGGTGPIIGKMGTKLFGDKTIFMYPNGQDFIYPFTIKLVEIYPVKDIILSQMPTVGEGKILESGGEIRVRAFKDTSELVLKPGKKFYMELDTASSPLLNGMSVYYGFNSGAVTDWTNNVSSLDPAISPDTLSSVINLPLYYGMNVARMGWVGCARLHSNANTTTAITFTAEGTNTENIDIFLVFKNIPSVMQVYNLQSHPLPVGTEVTVIAISKDSNQGNALVYDKQDITVSNGQQITLNFTTISEVDLLNVLSGL